MSDAWAGNFPLACGRVAEKTRVENKYRDHCMTMLGKFQDGGGDSLDGRASSLRTVGDTGRRFKWCHVQTITRRAAAFMLLRGLIAVREKTMAFAVEAVG
jgi:hypothetical protein